MCDFPIKLRTGSVVPCGYCAACMGRRINDWYTRLYYEAINSNFLAFCTITYDDENLPEGERSAILNFRDTQLFFKRVRKKYKHKIKYFLCGEYGEKRHRPHYHFILFSESIVNLDELLGLWKLGNYHFGEVTTNSLFYVLKDMMKSQNQKKRYEVMPSIRCSQGLGDIYFVKQSKWHNEDFKERIRVYRDGSMVHMPRRFREKTFSKFRRDIQNAIFQEQNVPVILTQRQERVKNQGALQRLNAALRAKHKKEKL